MGMGLVRKPGRACGLKRANQPGRRLNVPRECSAGSGANRSCKLVEKQINHVQGARDECGSLEGLADGRPLSVILGQSIKAVYRMKEGSIPRLDPPDGGCSQ